MTPVAHLGGLGLFLLLAGAPVPLGVYLATLTDARPLRVRPAHGALVILTAWCVVHVAVGLMLGIFHRFGLGPLVVVESLVALGGLALLRSGRHPAPLAGPEAAPTPCPAPSRLRAAILAAIAAVGVALFVRLARHPFTDYDSLAYHLPAMARWYQTGSLAMLDQFFNKSRYPYNSEVLSALFFMPFGDDVLIALPKLIAWTLFGLATYLSALQLGAGRVHGLVSALLVLTMPLVLWHVNTMLVDLPLAAFFMASLYLGTSYMLTGAPSELALFVAALGVLAGTKTSALPYVAVLLGAVAAFPRPPIRPRDTSWPPAGRPLVYGATACALLAGGFWYFRNLIEIGNPIGFVRVRVFGVTILSSVVDLIDLAEIRRTTLAHLFDVTNREHWRVLLEQLRLQLELPFFLLALETLPLLAVAATPERPVRPGRRLWLAGLLVATGFLYWSTPYNSDFGEYRFQIDPEAIGTGFRFGLPFVGVLGVAAAAGTTLLRVPDAGLVAVAALGAGAALRRDGSLGVALGLLACGLALSWTRLPAQIGRAGRRLSPAGRVAAALAGVAVLAGGTFWLRQERAIQRGLAYGGLPEYMAAHLGRDEIVGYLLSDRSYLFYGPDWAQRVVYTPATSPSMTGWLDRLRTQGVSVVAVGPVVDGWRSFGEPAWLEQPDGPFVRVFGRDPRQESVLYRIGAPGVRRSLRPRRRGPRATRSGSAPGPGGSPRSPR